MLIVNQVKKSFVDTPIVEAVTFTVNSGERLALIGPNGSGKTTLLSIITGRIKPDIGRVEFTAPGLRLGYLPQGAEFIEGETIGGYPDRCESHLINKSEKLAQLAAQITKHPDRTELQAEYDAILTQFELASEETHRGAAITAKMGLAHFSFDTPIEHLSGGQKNRLALAGALVDRPQILLLDEPTNHLDLEMLAWLEDWLREFSWGVLYVSHDRSFLDRTATGILELDPNTRTVHRYVGNYTAYLEEKLDAREKQRQEYSDQQEEIARLQSAIKRKKKEATCELPTAKASWLPVSSSLPGCLSSPGSYMLSTVGRDRLSLRRSLAPTGTSRDTHGSLFQNLDGRMAFLTALQKQTSSNRCTFAANMLRAATSCPLSTEKKDSRSWLSKRSFHHLAF